MNLRVREPKSPLRVLCSEGILVMGVCSFLEVAGVSLRRGSTRGENTLSKRLWRLDVGITNS